MTSRCRWGTVAATVVVAAAWYFGGPFRKREVPLLMYHHVGPTRSDIWTVSRTDFELQMRQLKADGYETVVPSDLVDYVHRRRRLPPKPVIITFDDGSLSVKDVARPILRRYGFRAIVYLATGAIEDSADGRGAVDGHPCLTWAEVRHLHEEGTLAFGGHTRQHDRKAFTADPANDIEACYRDIVNQGGFTPDSFSYPYNEGAGNLAVEKIIRQAGFTTAVTCTEGRATIRKKTRMLQLPRLCIRGGHHVFSVTRISPAGAAGQVVLRVSHDGFSFPVTPRFVWPGMPKHAGWLPTFDMKSGVTLLSSPAAGVPSGQGTVSLELWDRNRFFKLHAWPPTRE